MTATRSPAQAHTAALPTVRCAGVPVATCTPEAAAERVLSLASAVPRRAADVHLCNAYTLALADRDPVLRDLLRAASDNFPDGQSLVWANRLRYGRAAVSPQRVYGPSLFLDVVDRGRALSVGHYLLGSTPLVMDRLRQNLLGRYPGARIVGCLTPPYGPWADAERARIVEDVVASGADVVWVGLGTPRQDVESVWLTQRAPVVAVAVGAAFDFIAGTKRQAPPWMGSHGLEWAFRLASEPRRLWRRYLFGNAAFLRAAFWPDRQ